MDLVGFAVAAVHVLVAAVWLGAMAYSLVVVQPRAARLLGLERYEELATVLAAGARWSVLSMCAALAATGAALVALAYAATGEADPGGPWLALVAVKAVLLVAAVAVFARVSWRLWPQRLFALPAELPELHRTFRRTAYVLMCLVGTEIVLGAAARTWR